MEKKTFLVTNRGTGSITLVGRSRINIPGECRDFPVSLSAEKAQAIVSRLKRTYPLLKIVEDTAHVRQDKAPAKEPQGDTAPQQVQQTAAGSPDAAQSTPAPHTNAKKKQG